MLTRYRGETHKQFIDRLQSHNDLLHARIRDYDKVIHDIYNNSDVVHRDTFIALTEKYEAAVEKLKSLGVWCGE